MPKPRGLTIPAATIATRFFIMFEPLNLTLQAPNPSRFLLHSQSKHFTNVAQTKTKARKLVDCQLSLFSGDLKSGKREQ